MTRSVASPAMQASRVRGLAVGRLLSRVLRQTCRSAPGRGRTRVAVQRAGSGSIDEMHAIAGGAPQDHIGPVATGRVVRKPGLDLLTRRGASVGYADHVEL